jgi:hypothetical protein
LNESLPGRIFISYRRQETEWPARHLYQVLVEDFSAEQVFKDVDNIDPGDDFDERITSAVGSCDVLLALIGPQWLTVADENGQPRLNNPEDYVRLEIETALTRKIRVIPILVDGARMPGKEELPDTLVQLAYRQAVEINARSFDTKRLITMVHDMLAARRRAEEGARRQAEAAERARRQAERGLVRQDQPGWMREAVLQQNPPTVDRGLLKRLVHDRGSQKFFICDFCGARVKGRNFVTHIDRQHSSCAD